MASQFLLLALACLAGGGEGVTPAPDSADVLALLARRCVGCHGPKKQSGKLRLDALDRIFRGGRSGPAVVGGDVAASVLLERIAPGAEERMPPEDEGEPLTEEEVTLIRRWIEAGAVASPETAPARPEAVTLEPGALPAALASCFALAGERDGGRLALGRGGRVEVIDIAAEEKEEEKEKEADEEVAPRRAALLEGPRDLVQSLAWSLDGGRLAAGEYRAVHVWESGEWNRERVLQPHADRVLALDFSPDGRRLAAGGGLPTESGEVTVWDLESGEPVWSASPHTDTVLGLAWSDDGAFLFTGGADRVSYVLDAASGDVRSRLEGHTHHVLAVALSPDGKLAVTAGADRVLRLWDLAEGAARGSFQPAHGGEATAVAFLPDGRQVVSSSEDGSLRVWDTRNRRQRRSFGDPRGHLQAACVFAKGTRAAAASQEGGLWIFDLEKNRLLHALEPERPSQ